MAQFVCKAGTRTFPPVLGCVRPREQHAIARTRDPAWTGSGNLYPVSIGVCGGAKGENRLPRIFPTCRPAYINPTPLSTSSIYLALLFHGFSVCAYTLDFLPRGGKEAGRGKEERAKEDWEQRASGSGVEETGARYKRHQKMAGGFDPAKNPASASAPFSLFPTPAPSGRLICRLRLTVEPVSAKIQPRKRKRESGGPKINNPSATMAGKNIAD